jgi:hypothetical protein
MSRRSWLSAAVLLASVLSLGTVGVATSHAGTGPPPPPPPRWPGPTICAQGSLVGGTRMDVPVHTPLVMDIEPCAGTEPAVVDAARWGVAKYFGSGGYVSDGSAFRFSPSGRRSATLYGFRDGTLSDGDRGEVRAACLIAGRALTRVACVRVEAVGPDGTIAITPLPVDHPLVFRPVWVFDGPDTPDPECAACV